MRQHTNNPAKAPGICPDFMAAAPEEMAAIAWAYAAALHVGLPPEVVFHQHGYKGQSKGILDRFANADFIGLPYPWWIGLTPEAFQGRPSICPRMIRWLREEPVPILEPEHFF